MKQALIVCLCVSLIVMLAELYAQSPKRLPNRKRKRQHAVDKLGEFSDFEFKRQTGLSRKTFNYVLGLIRPTLINGHGTSSENMDIVFYTEILWR